MTEVMLTSGQGFEGYEIVEYLGFVNVQSVLSSNFFKGFAAGVSEMSDSESEKLTGKLEQVNETALKRLQTIAARKKADAVIGVELNYTQFASYSVEPSIIVKGIVIVKFELLIRNFTYDCPSNSAS